MIRKHEKKWCWYYSNISDCVELRHIIYPVSLLGLHHLGVSHKREFFQTLSIEALQLELREIIGIRLKVLKDDEKLYISVFCLEKGLQKYFWNSNLINLLQASWLGLLNIHRDRRKLNLHSERFIWLVHI